MAFPDVWGEGTALVDIAVLGGGAGVNFSTALSSINIDMGDRSIDSVHTVRGAKLKKYTPEEDTTIEFEGYPVNLDTTSTDVLQRYFVAWASRSTSVLTQTQNNLLTRNDFRVTILFTKATGTTTAYGAVASTNEALRFIAKKCTLISVKPSFTDNELKFVFKFKVCAYAKTTTLGGAFETGSTNYLGNLCWQSSNGTTTLPALGNYA